MFWPRNSYAMSVRNTYKKNNTFDSFVFEICTGSNTLPIGSTQGVLALQYIHGRPEQYMLNVLFPEQVHVQHVLACTT